MISADRWWRSYGQNSAAIAGSIREWSEDAACSPPRRSLNSGASQSGKAELKIPSRPLADAACIIPEEGGISEEGVLATPLGRRPWNASGPERVSVM